jgi:hypothetical protein
LFNGGQEDCVRRPGNADGDVRRGVHRCVIAGAM